MSERDSYPPGVPCWVDVLVPDPARALDFYGELFGWQFDGPGPGEYYEAGLRGRPVAGVGGMPSGVPSGVPTAWTTYIAVDSAEAITEAAGDRVLVQPLDVLPAGRVAVIADPSGGAIGLWEAAERRGCAVVNEPSAYTMSVLHTSDPDGAARFYSDIFGWETESFAPGMTLFRLPGYVGGEPAQPVPRDVVAVMIEAEAAPAHWTVGFWARDADEVAAQAPGLGGSVLAAPSDDQPMRQAVLADPFGAVFSVTTAPGG